MPDLEEYWFEIYGRVAFTGESVRFEHKLDVMKRWFDVYSSRIGNEGSNRVVIVFNNIIQRKQAEAALRESEERMQRVLETDAVGVLFFNL